MTSTWRYSSLLAALLLPVSAAQADELQAKQYADFDSYVLALSWQTGFCQSQHERNRQNLTNVVYKESADKAIS
jgi:ribonuclease I